MSLVLLGLVVTGCDYNTIEEYSPRIENNHIENIEDIIHEKVFSELSKEIRWTIDSVLHIENLQNGVIVFYSVPDNSQSNYLIGMDFLRKKSDGSLGKAEIKGLDDYYNEQMSFCGDSIRLEPSDENNFDRLLVVFGQINDENIKNVQVAKKTDRPYSYFGNNEYTSDYVLSDAEIIHHALGRLYYYYETISNPTSVFVKGLNEDGEVIYPPV